MKHLKHLESSDEKPELSDYFTNKKVLEFATIYSVEPIEDWQFNSIDEDEMEEENFRKFKIAAGTRVGFAETDDGFNAEIAGVIEFTKDGYYYNYDEEMISDNTITFEVEKGVGFAPASEPVDLIPDYTNGGGGKIENKKEAKNLVKLYKLDHYLLGA